MGEEIAIESGRISDFHGLVTLTLTRVILHTVMHHSSTSTYVPYFIEINKNFCGRTDKRTDRRTYGWQNGHLRTTNSTQSSRPNKPDSVTNLGVIFDSNLSFRGHISQKTNKAYITLGIIKRNFIYKDKTNFYTEQLYKSMVRPHLEYANSLWRPYKMGNITR